MTTYRMTLRHGSPGKRYHVVDFEATDIRGALLQAVNAFPAGSEASADLIEIRVHMEAEQRNYTPE
jgi:hypothetical protein